MPTDQDYMNYLRKMMDDTPEINEATDEELEKLIYKAGERIIMFYGDDIKLDERMIYLQVSYELEGESEGLAMLRRQGISEARMKEVQLKLDGAQLSPGLYLYLDTKHDHAAGSLIGELI